MRTSARRVAGPVALLSLVFALIAGCGSSQGPPPTPDDLIRAYLVDKDVVNDIVGENPSGSPADRRANIFGYFGVNDLAGLLFAAAPCGVRPRATFTDPVGDLGCPPSPEVTAAVGDDVLVQGMLVRHDDGRLELVPLYVARAGGVLADSTGQTYRGGLDDFRRHNDVLARDDQVLVLSDPQQVPGTGELVVVSGSTAPPVTEILLAVLGGVVLVLVVVAVVRRRRRGPDDRPATAGP